MHAIPCWLKTSTDKSPKYVHTRDTSKYTDKASYTELVMKVYHIDSNLFILKTPSPIYTYDTLKNSDEYSFVDFVSNSILVKEKIFQSMSKEPKLTRKRRNMVIGEIEKLRYISNHQQAETCIYRQKFEDLEMSSRTTLNRRDEMMEDTNIKLEDGGHLKD